MREDEYGKPYSIHNHAKDYEKIVAARQYEPATSMSEIHYS